MKSISINYKEIWLLQTNLGYLNDMGEMVDDYCRFSDVYDSKKEALTALQSFKENDSEYAQWYDENVSVEPCYFFEDENGRSWVNSHDMDFSDLLEDIEFSKIIDE